MPLSSTVRLKTGEVSIIESIGEIDQAPVNGLLAYTRLGARAEQDRTSLRVECECNPYRRVSMIDSKFFHICVLRSLQRIHMGTAKRRPGTPEQIDFSDQVRHRRFTTTKKTKYRKHRWSRLATISAYSPSTTGVKHEKEKMAAHPPSNGVNRLHAASRLPPGEPHAQRPNILGLLPPGPDPVRSEPLARDPRIDTA